MLTVTFPTTVELSIDGESQTIANLIGAYKDVVMAGTELNLAFAPRVEGRADRRRHRERRSHRGRQL